MNLKFRRFIYKTLTLRRQGFISHFEISYTPPEAGSREIVQRSPLLLNALSCPQSVTGFVFMFSIFILATTFWSVGFIAIIKCLASL